MGCPPLGTTLGQVVLCTYHKNEKYFHGTIQFSPKSMLRMLKNGLGKNHFSPTLTRLQTACYANPSAIDSDSLEPLSVLRSKQKVKW